MYPYTVFCLYSGAKWQWKQCRGICNARLHIWGTKRVGVHSLLPIILTLWGEKECRGTLFAPNYVDLMGGKRV